MKKSMLFFCLILILGISFIPAQSVDPKNPHADNPALKPIINNFGARNYAAGAVTKAELDIILLAGTRAPSAANRQPWRFTVVQNQNLAKQIVPQISDNNILIIVSAQGDGKTNTAFILDCALAAQSMYLAAQALGLGSRIYTGPMENINTRLKPELGIPNDHNAIVLIRIGRLPPGVDAVNSASPRNNADRVVTYK